MNRFSIKSGTLAIAFGVGWPLLLLAAIWIPGGLYCRNGRKEIEEREKRVRYVPKMERQAAEARAALRPFSSANPLGERTAALSLAVNQAAQANGFAARSVNVEKQPGSGTDPWTDCKVSIEGDCTLKSVIGLLDTLEQPQRHLRVRQVILRAKVMASETVYDGDLVFLSRVVPAAQVGMGGGGTKDDTSLAKLDELGGRLSVLAADVKAGENARRAAIATLKLDGRKPVPVPEAAPDAPVTFTLTGIVRSKDAPMALTDRGVFGLGEEIDGYEFVAIGKDSVTVKNRHGRRVTIPLYRDEAQP